MTRRPLMQRSINRQRRNAVASGWAAFAELRTPPKGNYEPVRHGNWIHGEYSREGIEAHRKLRETVRFLRAMRAGRFYPSPFPPSQPKGWKHGATIRRAHAGQAKPAAVNGM